jgi:hypothetical protein
MAPMVRSNRGWLGRRSGSHAMDYDLACDVSCRAPERCWIESFHAFLMSSGFFCRSTRFEQPMAKERGKSPISGVQYVEFKETRVKVASVNQPGQIIAFEYEHERFWPCTIAPHRGCRASPANHAVAARSRRGSLFPLAEARRGPVCKLA